MTASTLWPLATINGLRCPICLCTAGIGTQFLSFYVHLLNSSMSKREVSLYNTYEHLFSWRKRSNSRWSLLWASGFVALLSTLRTLESQSCDRTSNSFPPGEASNAGENPIAKESLRSQPRIIHQIPSNDKGKIFLETSFFYAPRLGIFYQGCWAWL